jgi:hypothetical protein
MLMYLFLAVVVVYCLIQSVRFRVARLKHRADRPDLRAFVTADPEHAVEEALLTEKGRDLYHTHKFYDAVGVMAALAFLMIWASDSGVLEAVLEAVR